MAGMDEIFSTHILSSQTVSYNGVQNISQDPAVVCDVPLTFRYRQMFKLYSADTGFESQLLYSFTRFSSLIPHEH